MAKKNKKKGQAKFPVPMPVVAAILAAAGLALFYVCFQARTETLGREIKVLEAARDSLRDQLVREQCEWARLQSPSSLAQSLASFGLVMTWPGRDQIVRVRYDGSLDSPRGYAMRLSSGVARADRVVMND
ncbi:MAG: hypothetical protein WCO77_01650 [bacterium]|jgi:hypothetical protein